MSDDSNSLITTEKNIIDSKIFDLSEDDEQKIIKGQLKKTGFEIIGDTLGIGSIAKLFSINDHVNKEIRQEKTEKVINACFALSKNNEKTLNQLLKLLKSKTGNILFNKFIFLLDDVNPDNDQYIGYFSIVLDKILTSDFDKLFEKHNYALSIIGSISIQATAILADNKNWKTFSLEKLKGQFSFEDRVLTTDRWKPLFTEKYLENKSINGTTYEEVKSRVVHSLSELQRYELVVPKVLGSQETMSMGNIKEANMGAQLQLTNIGLEIVSYFRKG